MMGIHIMIGILMCAVMISRCDRKLASGPIPTTAIETAVTQELNEKWKGKYFQINHIDYVEKTDHYQIAITGLTDKGRKQKAAFNCFRDTEKMVTNSPTATVHLIPD